MTERPSIVLRLREFVRSISSEGYPTSDKRIAAMMDDAAAKIERVLAALAECEAYFAERADVVDGSYGEPAPNREMSLLSEIKEVLGEALP